MRAGQEGRPCGRYQQLVSPVIGDDVEVNLNADIEMREGHTQEQFDDHRDRAWENAMRPFDPGEGKGGEATAEAEKEQEMRDAEADGEEELERPSGLGQSVAMGGGQGSSNPEDVDHGHLEGSLDGEQGGAEGQEEEGAQPRGLSTPARVTAEERERHELTHTPFRSWCRACVKGRAMNMAHRSRSEENKREDHAVRGVPRVAMDYMYLNDQLDDVAQSPIIVMVDEGTGEKYARVVPLQGGWGPRARRIGRRRTPRTSCGPGDMREELGTDWS